MIELHVNQITWIRLKWPTQLLAVILICAGCGSGSLLNSDSTLKIRMFGSLEAPVGAEGSLPPISQTFLFKGLTLTKADGSGDVELYEDDPFTVRIVSRPQQIFKYEKLGDYIKDKVSFSAVTVRFDQQIVVATKETDDAIIRLDSGNFTITEALTPTASKEFTLNIRVSWGKTVAVLEDKTELLTAPGIQLTYKNSAD